MQRLRHDFYMSAVQQINADLIKLDISQRALARHIRVSTATLNSFLNRVYNKPHRKTVENLLNARIWSQQTRTAIERLRDYEELMFREGPPPATENG